MSRPEDRLQAQPCAHVRVRSGQGHGANFPLVFLALGALASITARIALIGVAFVRVHDDWGDYAGILAIPRCSKIGH